MLVGTTVRKRGSEDASLTKSSSRSPGCDLLTRNLQAIRCRSGATTLEQSARATRTASSAGTRMPGSLPASCSSAIPWMRTRCPSWSTTCRRTSGAASARSPCWPSVTMPRSPSMSRTGFSPESTTACRSSRSRQDRRRQPAVLLRRRGNRRQPVPDPGWLQVHHHQDQWRSPLRRRLQLPG